jgi:hypothetical protein
MDTSSVFGRMQSGKLVSLPTPPGKSVSADRYPFPLNQPICKRKMNACWDARHVCSRIITHTLPLHPIKSFDDEHQSPSHPASAVTISAPAPSSHTLYNGNKGRPAAVEISKFIEVIHAASPDTPLHMRRSSSVPFSAWRRNPSLHNVYDIPQL